MGRGRRSIGIWAPLLGPLRGYLFACARGRNRLGVQIASTAIRMTVLREIQRSLASGRRLSAEREPESKPAYPLPRLPRFQFVPHVPRRFGARWATPDRYRGVWS